MSLPTIAVVAAGAMGAAVGRRLVNAGLKVLTTLEGRSTATRSRAEKAGLQDASLKDIASTSNWVLSILPPGEAYNFARQLRDAHASVSATRSLAFADCNAVNPETVKQIAALFAGTSIKFVDAGIIGGPPQDDYDPVIYASVDPADDKLLDEFASLSKYGLNVKPLRGEGAGIGDASALKMSYAGITKGIIGLCSTMILSAHAASPATSEALLQELAYSQPNAFQHIIRSQPTMLPKAYRWVAEMEEISAFVTNGLASTRTAGEPEHPTAKAGEPHAEGHIHFGLARLYENIARAVAQSANGEDVGEAKALKEFVQKAKDYQNQQK